MRKLVIDAAALARNLDRLRRAASARIIGVVKGNGYGLGLTDYARFLTEHGVDMLAVSTAEEAAALRQAGIAAEVLMLSSTAVPRDVAVLLDCGAILTVGSCAAAETVSAVAVEKGVTARVHVKLDTGMGRFGFLPQDVTEAAALLKSLPSMRVEGVFTHFANAADEALTRRQYQRFQEGAALLERAGIETGLRLLRVSAVSGDAAGRGASGLGAAGAAVGAGPTGAGEDRLAGDAGHGAEGLAVWLEGGLRRRVPHQAAHASGSAADGLYQRRGSNGGIQRPAPAG